MAMKVCSPHLFLFERLPTSDTVKKAILNHLWSYDADFQINNFIFDGENINIIIYVWCINNIAFSESIIYGYK